MPPRLCAEVRTGAHRRRAGEPHATPLENPAATPRTPRRAPRRPLGKSPRVEGRPQLPQRLPQASPSSLGPAQRLARPRQQRRRAPGTLVLGQPKRKFENPRSPARVFHVSACPPLALPDPRATFCDCPVGTIARQDYVGWPGTNSSGGNDEQASVRPYGHHAGGIIRDCVCCAARMPRRSTCRSPSRCRPTSSRSITRDAIGESSSSVALNAALTANGDGRHGGTSIGTVTMTTATTTNAAMASAIIPVATGAAMTASPCSSASRG